jgi:hypothetical protein
VAITLSRRRPGTIGTATVTRPGATGHDPAGASPAAHDAAARRVRKALLGKPLAVAQRDLVALADDALRLPALPLTLDTIAAARAAEAANAATDAARTDPGMVGVARRAVEAAHAATARARASGVEGDRSPGDGDLRGIFAAAWAAFLPARDAARDASHSAARLDTLEDLAAAYLCLHDALPPADQPVPRQTKLAPVVQYCGSSAL